LAAEKAQLFAVIVDDSQLRCPNLFIQAGEFGDKPSPLKRLR
jgi:hypothetical protein